MISIVFTSFLGSRLTSIYAAALKVEQKVSCCGPGREADPGVPAFS
jgi:hypothetical protein